MKKNTARILGVLMVFASTLFTGCDNEPFYDNSTWSREDNNGANNGSERDEDFLVSMAQTLAGQWRGDMKAYQIDKSGKAIDSIYYKTDIEFKQYNDRSISGTGTQYDFHPDTEKPELQRDFTWYIDPKTANVYMTYKEKDGKGRVHDYVMVIAYDDLNLNDRRFTGYLNATDGHEVDDFWFDRYLGTRASIGKDIRSIRVVMQ